MTDYTSQITGWYEAVQFRAPPAADLAVYNAQLNSGGLTAAQVQLAIINDPYTVSIVNPVIREYQAAFGRVPDWGGLQYWVGIVASNPTAGLAALSSGFAASTEFLAEYGVSGNAPVTGNTAFVTSLYANVLGRAPDAAGLAYWTTSTLTVSQVLQGFAQSTEFTTNTASNIVAYEQLVLAGTPVTSGPLTSVGQSSSNFPLTTGVDVATATNFTGSLTTYLVDGKGPTLNPGDTLTGTNGQTNNTLTITDLTAGASDVLPSGVVLKNIQDVILNTTGNAGGFSTTGVTGVENLTVLSAGSGNDIVQAANGASGAAITVNHNNSTGGGVEVLGGSSVTVTTAGQGNATFGANTLSGGAVLVGLSASGTVPQASQLATGAISVTSTNTSVGNIDIVGGSSVTVNAEGASFSGTINIGNVAINTGASIAGAIANAAGAISVTDAGVGQINIAGGSTVTVSAAGGNVVVGEASPKAASDEATGAIQVADTAAVAYDGIASGTTGLSTPGPYSNSLALVNVFGGTTVNVTTNTASVVVGTSTAVSGTLPTGNVTVTSTANDLTDAVVGNAGIAVFGGAAVTVSAQDVSVNVGGATAGDTATGAVSITETAASSNQDVVNGVHAIVIDGGNGVTVSAQGQNVVIGARQGTSGAQQVTQSGVLTGGANGTVAVNGGTTVTVNTTGGNVSIGAVATTTGALAAPTGAVSVADTFGSGNAANDAISILGGTTVQVTLAAADKGAITIGAAPLGTVNAEAAVNAGGSALKAAADFATGNVTIADSQTNGATTTYGTGAVNVLDNGGATVSITGGAVGVVADVESTIATGGVGAGKAVGTSTLTTVVLDGNQATATSIQSDVLASLSVLDVNTAADAITVTNNTAGNALALTIGNDGKAVQINDATATSITLADNGVASTGVVTIADAKLTSFTATNTAAATVNLIPDAALTTITLKNTGSINLGNLSSLAALTTVNATAATGAVSVEVNTGVTSFNGVGDTAAETVGLSANALGTGVKIAGGSGSNTLVADYNAAVGDTALGNNSGISGFKTLQIDTGYGSANTGVAYSTGTVARAQVETITITNEGAGAVYNVSVNGGAVSTITDAAGTLTPAQIAGALAAGLVVPVGYTVSSGAGGAFTITGPTTTVFTVSTAGSTVGGVVDAHTQSAAAAVASDASYDATGFSSLIVGSAPTGGLSIGPGTNNDVSFINVAKNDTITIDHSTGGVVNVVGVASATTETLNIGVDGTTKTGTASQTQAVYIKGVSTLTEGSYGEVTSATGVAQTNTLSTADTALKTLNITGDQSLIASLYVDSGLTLATELTSNVTTIDASAATGNVTLAVALKSGVAHAITGGAGLLTVADGQTQTDVDTIVSGAGGVKLTLSGTGGGSWNGTNYGAGSVSVALSASASAQDILTERDGAVETNNGTAGGVTGFIAGVKNADELSFSSANKSVVVVAAATPQAITDGSNVNSLFALPASVLNSLTYTVTNGVITFSATGGHQLSDFTSGQLVTAAEIIVDNVGPNEIAAFSTSGNTYVVSSGSVASAAAAAAGDSIVELVGLASVAGFGQTGAVNTIGTDGTVTYAAHGVSNSGTASAAVYAEGGYAADTITTFGTSSTSISGLAASAVVTLNDGSGTAAPVTISQTGGAGNTSLTLNVGNGDTFNSITVNGDATLAINPTGSVAIHSLVDSANTLSTITVAAGGGALDIGAITDTALTKVDAHNATGAFTLGDLTPIANASLTVNLAVGQTSNVTVSGATDTVVDGSSTGAFGAGIVHVTANGQGDTITVSSSDNTGGVGGNNITANGANDTINLGNNGTAGEYTVSALGSNDTIVFTATHNAASTVTVGSSATVTFGAGNESVVITGDLTGATSGGSYAVTTLNNAAHAVAETIVFNNATTESLIGQVNVASAKTLAAALDLAASQAALTANPNPGSATYATLAAHSGVIDWFQFGGNTYVVEANNSTGASATHSALAASDAVVKITGLVDLSSSSFSGLSHTLTV